MNFSDPPPPYTPRKNNEETSDDSCEAHSPQPASVITPSARRSMEDELRTLPYGWIRQYDSESGHQFFVDTSKNPPRSIWHHPYDDAEYRSTLSSLELLRLEIPDNKDRPNSLSSPSSSTSRYGLDESSNMRRPGIQKFGRKLKDIITSTTHEERIKARKERDDMEIEAYHQHQHQQIRNKMIQAAKTGEPQLFGIDSDGKEIWIKAPTNNVNRNRLDSHSFAQNSKRVGIGLSTSSLRDHQNWNGYSSNPYASRYMNGINFGYNLPYDPYHRPTGSGFGGGMGLPLGLGLTGGMLFGGMLL
ncbi:putative ww rsp5 wwp protein [Erysiphe neolycopersici]|uniref:Putative ww rsp5 wwp protein n=1 Tax=Erysiphe neolycopersici TaxID=212602 RepID=A0A420HA30_9PEZI|nr:putative ww rsp5 wwp protein [Erysiphe neolycopersici]